ncbi:MAG: hypothetical protein LBM02_03355 [Lachnospiraceae bacterium]|jgi:hypothetical protein|nr:hypothetical protein [Lachnospiraceae bacterium]
MSKDKIFVALDKNGNKVVVINEIIFHGKRKQPWKEIEKYLKKYIGQIIEVSESNELIEIGKDFPDEFTHSRDTYSLRGGYARAKANIINSINELIMISRKTKENDNFKDKHRNEVKKWYRYLSRFAFPVENENNIISHYNIFICTLIVKKDISNRMFLYDIVKIKKENIIEFFI